MQVGDRKTCRIQHGEHMPFTREGSVTYIHPERRFYIVRFDCPQGRCYSESFYFPHRAGNMKASPYLASDEGNHSRLLKPVKEVRKRSFL